MPARCTMSSSIYAAFGALLLGAVSSLPTPRNESEIPPTVSIAPRRLSILPMFFMYFPTALFGIRPPDFYSDAYLRFPYTGAAFFPSELVMASLIWLLATFVVFQLLPFLGALYTIAKYGIDPKRGDVNNNKNINYEDDGASVKTKRSRRTTESKKTESKFKSKSAKVHDVLSDPRKAPTIIIVMPIYNEEPDALFNAVLSVTRANYLKSCMHLFVSFDDESVSELYLRLLDKMGVFQHAAESSKSFDGINISSSSTDEPLAFSDVEAKFLKLKRVMSDGSVGYDIPTQFTVTFEGVCVTICRFPHNGKRATQAKTFKLINKMYGHKGSNTERTYVLYIDSDVILERNAIYEFTRAMELQPEKVAYTGYITCRTSLAPTNFLVAYQDSEYLHSQLIHRSFEAILGGVVCLPGALTMVRLRALKEVAPHYFTRLNTDKTLDYHRFHLGEDRYMTHLLMDVATNHVKVKKRKQVDRRRRAAGKPPLKKPKHMNNSYTIGFCSSARCKTEAPDTWQKLLKQRRRWFLGAIANEIFMLIAPELWRQTPILMLTKLWDFGLRSLIIYVTLFNIFLNYVVFPNMDLPHGEYITTAYSKTSNTFDFMQFLFPISKPGQEVYSWIVPLLIFVGPLAGKWLLLIWVGIVLRRWRMSLLYPAVVVLQPAFGLAFTMYALRTYATRSWGGPRTDRGDDEDPMKALERIWSQLNVPNPDEKPEEVEEDSDDSDDDEIYEMFHENRVDILGVGSRDTLHDPAIDNIDVELKTPEMSPDSKNLPTPRLRPVKTPAPAFHRASVSERILSWLPKRQSVIEKNESKRYTLQFIDFKMLEEDDKNTMYRMTLDRHSSKKSSRKASGATTPEHGRSRSESGVSKYSFRPPASTFNNQKRLTPPFLDQKKINRISGSGSVAFALPQTSGTQMPAVMMGFASGSELSVKTVHDQPDNISPNTNNESPGNSKEAGPPSS
ncbi:hypothetical protein HK098_006890 [Nowakowskiella sp. JEL0407]|nr:hypothetical protein HK098_006890 [Nowakowskiella sp. JEL0407]